MENVTARTGSQLLQAAEASMVPGPRPLHLVAACESKLPTFDLVIDALVQFKSFVFH